MMRAGSARRPIVRPVTRLPQPRQQAGFTLVEVILSLVLFSLISLALVAAMGTMGNTYSRTAERVDANADLRIVGGFLHQTLSQSLVVFPPGGDELPSNPYFQGNEQELTFVGNLSGYQGPGGVHLMHLAFDAQDGQLAVAILPWRADPDWSPDWGNAETVVLLPRLDSFRLAYLGHEGEDDWRQSWDEPRAYPLALRLNVVVEERHWPEMVVWLGGHRAAP